MGVDALSWAFRLKLPPTEKLVLLAYADRANPDGTCYPSVRDTMDRTGFCERTIRNTTKTLADMNLLTVIPRFTTIGGQRSNLYRLHLGEAGKTTLHPLAPRYFDLDPPDSVWEHPPEVRCTRGGAPHSEGGLKRDAPITVTRTVTKEPSLEPSFGVREQARVQNTTASGKEDKQIARSTEPKAVKKNTSAPRRSRLPDDWQPSPADRAYAEKHGVDPDREGEKFLAYHAGKGTVWVDWHRAWQSWVLRAEPDLQASPARTQPPRPLFADDLFNDRPAQPPQPADASDPWGMHAFVATLPDTGIDKINGAICLGDWEIEGVVEGVCQAAGLPPTWRGDLEPIARWLRAGFEPADIKATIRALVGKARNPATWSYYHAALVERAERNGVTA